MSLDVMDPKGTTGPRAEPERVYFVRRDSWMRILPVLPGAPEWRLADMPDVPPATWRLNSDLSASPHVRERRFLRAALHGVVFYHEMGMPVEEAERALFAAGVLPASVAQ
jgi:hypothetical protein